MTHEPECPLANDPTCGECLCSYLEDAYQRGREDALLEVDQQNFVIDEGQPYAEAWRHGYKKGREDAATAVEAIHKPASYGYVYLEENSDAVDAVVCESCWDGEYRFDVYPCETLLAARGDVA